MKNASFSIEELFRFLDAGVSAFHSTAAAAGILLPPPGGRRPPFWKLRAM